MLRWITRAGAGSLIPALVACVTTGAPSSPSPSRATDRPTLVIEPVAGELPSRGRRTQAPPAERCPVTTDDFAAAGQPWPLLLGDRTRWALLRPEAGGEATAFLADGDADRLPYAFIGDGLRLEGQVPADAVYIYSSEPVWFGGVVVARRRHAFDFVSADAERVELELELGTDFSPTRVSRRVDCGWLQLVAGSFDEPVQMRPHQPRVIVGDEPVPLFAQPEGGESTVALELGAGAQITAGPVQGDRQRVLLGRPAFYVFAWVPVARLQNPKRIQGWGTTGGSGVHTRPRRRFGANARRDYRCKRRVPLHVVVADRRERVGSVLPGRVFWVNLHEPPERGLQKIRVDDGPVQLEGGARFAVSAGDLRGCDSL